MDLNDNLIIGCVRIPFNQTRLNIVETPKNRRINVQNQPQDQKIYNSKETQFIITTIFDEEHLFSKMETIDNTNVYCNLQALLYQFEITPFITIYSQQLAKLLNYNFIKSEMFENQVNAVLTSISIESIPDIPKGFAVNMQFVVANLGIQYGSALPNVQFYKQGSTITSKAYESSDLKKIISEKINSNVAYKNAQFQTFNIDYKKNISDAINGMNKALNTLKSLKQFRPINTTNNEQEKINFNKYKTETIDKYELAIEKLKSETTNVLKELDKSTFEMKTQKTKYGYQNNVQQLQMETVSKVPVYQYFGRTNQQMQIEFVQKNQSELKELINYIQQLVQLSKYLQNIGKKQQITFNDTLSAVIGKTSFFIDMLQYSNIDSSPSAFTVDIQLVEQNDDFEQDFIFDRDKMFQKSLFEKISEEFTKDTDINFSIEESLNKDKIQNTNTESIDIIYPYFYIDQYSKNNLENNEAFNVLTQKYFDLYINTKAIANDSDLLNNFFCQYIYNILKLTTDFNEFNKDSNTLLKLKNSKVIDYINLYCQKYNIDIFTALSIAYKESKLGTTISGKNIFKLLNSEVQKLNGSSLKPDGNFDDNSYEICIAYGIQYMQFLKETKNISDDDISMHFREYNITDIKTKFTNAFKVNKIIIENWYRDSVITSFTNTASIITVNEINKEQLINFQRSLQSNGWIKEVCFADFTSQYLMKIQLSICNDEIDSLINNLSDDEINSIKRKRINPFLITTLNKISYGKGNIFIVNNNAKEIPDFVNKIIPSTRAYDLSLSPNSSFQKNYIKSNTALKTFANQLQTKYSYSFKGKSFSYQEYTENIRQELLNKFIQISHIDINLHFLRIKENKFPQYESVYIQDENQLSYNTLEKVASFVFPKDIKQKTLNIVKKYINDNSQANVVASFFITQHLISKQQELNLISINQFIQQKMINSTTNDQSDVDLKIKQYVKQLIDDNINSINFLSSELKLYPRLTNIQLQTGLMSCLIEFEDELYFKKDSKKTEDNQLIYTNLLWLLNYLYKYPDYGFEKLLKELDYNQYKSIDQKLFPLFTSIQTAQTGRYDSSGTYEVVDIDLKTDVDKLHEQFLEMKNVLSEYQDVFLTKEQYTQLHTHYNESQQQTNESKIGYTKDYFDNLKIFYDENTFKNQIRNIVSSVYCISDFDITIDNLFQNIIDAYLEKSTENILTDESKKIIQKIQENDTFNLGYGLGFNPEKIFYKYEQVENQQIKEYSRILLKVLKNSIIKMDALLKKSDIKAEEFEKIYKEMLTSLKNIIKDNTPKTGNTETTEFQKSTEAVENILKSFQISVSDINQVLGGTKELYKIEENELLQIIEKAEKKLGESSKNDKEQLDKQFEAFENFKIYQEQYAVEEKDNQQWSIINNVQQMLFGLENYDININIIQPKQSIIFLKRKVYENKQFNKKYFEYISKLFYKGIVNFSVSKSQESPQHQAIINLSNTSKSMLQQTSETDFQKYIYDDFSSNSDIDFYSMLSSVFLHPGTELQIVAGYTSDIYKLPCVFQGVVTQVQDGGDTITITADGYGRDLLIPKANNKYSAKAKLYIDPSDMVLKAIYDSGSYVFGQFTGYLDSEENPAGTTIIKDSYEILNYAYQEKYRKLGINVYRPDKYYKQLYSTNRNDKTFVMSDETKNNIQQQWTAFYNNMGFNFSNEITNNPYKPKSGYTPWDIITDAKLRVPNYIQYVDDFGIGSQRVFFGRPEWKQQTKPFIQKTEQKDFKEIKQKTDDIKSSWQNAFSEEFIVQQSIIYADFFPNANFLSKNKDKIKTVFEKIKKLKTEEFNVLKNNYIEQLNKISNDTELSSTKKVIDKIINYSKTKEIIKTNVQNIIAINLQQFDIEQSIEKISSKQDELQVMTLSFFKLLIQYSFCKQFDSIEDAINTSKKIDLNYEQTIIKNNKIPLQQSVDEYESMNLPVVYNNSNNYIENYIDNIINFKKYTKQTDSAVNLLRNSISFKKTYLASTERNIISNNICTDDNMVSNVVSVFGPCGFIDNKGFLGGILQMFGSGQEKQEINGKKMKCVSQILDPRIPDTQLKTMTYVDENGYVTQVDKIIASNLLQSSLQNYYQGTITLIGCPTIKPYDELKIQDTNRNVSGSVIVKEVITHFNSNTGFITQIVPQMKTEQTLPARIDSINYIWGDQLTLGVYATMIAFALTTTLSFGLGQIAFGSVLFATQKINTLTNDIIITPKDISDSEEQSYTNRYNVFNSIKILPLNINDQEIVPKFIRTTYPKFDGTSSYIIRKNTNEYWKNISLGISNIGYNQVTGTTNVLYDLAKLFNFTKTDANQSFNAQMLKGLSE